MHFIQVHEDDFRLVIFPLILFLTAFIFEREALTEWLFDFSAALNAEGVFQPQCSKCMWQKVNKYVFSFTDLLKKVVFHIRTNLSVFSSLLPTPTIPITACFIVWNASGFKKVFYLKQEYCLKMFYCIFIAPLVLLQFSTSKQRLHHLHVDYANMSDICNLIGLQLKKCF